MREARRHRGVILLVVLFVLILLGLLVGMFAFQVTADVASTRAMAYRLQTRLAAEAGVELVKLLLRDARLDVKRWYHNPEELHRIVVWVEGGDDTLWGKNDEFRGEPMCYRFSIVADDPSDDEEYIRIGITDESSKLNLNTAGESQLLILVRAAVGDNEEADPEEIVHAIMDWRDRDNIPLGRDGDTEGEYYRTLPKPYLVKNGPFDTVEELLLVKGMTGEILYGEDVDRNGLLTPNEDDGDASFPWFDNQDGVLNRGLYPFLTVLSAENNVGNDNRARVYLLGEEAKVRAELADVFPDEPEVVDFIVSAARARGGSGNAQGAGAGSRQPGSGQPAAGQSGSGQPQSGTPGSGQTGSGQPGTGQPAAGQSGSGQPRSGAPGSGQPGTQEPQSGQSGSGKPPPGKVGISQPSEGQPGTRPPTSGQSGSGQPGPRRPGSTQPGPGRPGVTQPQARQPGAGQPGTRQPGAGQPGAGAGPSTGAGGAQDAEGGAGPMGGSVEEVEPGDEGGEGAEDTEASAGAEDEGDSGGGSETDDGGSGTAPMQTPASLLREQTVGGQAQSSPLTLQHLPVLLDRTTMVAPEKGKKIAGLININTAPAIVLRCIDGLTAEQIAAMVEVRGTLDRDVLATPAWLLTEGVVDFDTFEKIAPRITARGQQFRIESLGYADHVGMVTRLEVVVDMLGPIAETVYYRDLTYLGGHYPIREDDLEKVRAR